MDKNKKRNWIQAAWALLTNSYLVGFVRGGIYKGPLKALCVPGLNCYSCPGALGSCPIGALQALAGSWKYQVGLYAVGFVMLVGAVLGRLVCGYLCPFGWIQDLLHKIPFPKKIVTFRGDQALRFVKYGVLAVFVLLLPAVVNNFSGQGDPWFCKWICPAGTLEGGVPLVAANPGLQAAVGGLFLWKLGLLAAVVLLSILLRRPFCKYLCPLGAIYALFNPAALYRYHVSEQRCTHCGACQKVCPMNLDPAKTPNHPECIRCGECRAACPHNAIGACFGKAGCPGAAGRKAQRQTP